MKIKWDDIWATLAKNVAQRSNDPKTKVGAVIVTQDNESVLSIGYNGDEKGGNNQRESLDAGGSGFIHAEENALIKLNYSDHRKRKIYITHSPCSMCAKRIINAGIDEVHYLEPFKNDMSGIDILIRSGVRVIHGNEKNEKESETENEVCQVLEGEKSEGKCSC